MKSAAIISKPSKPELAGLLPEVLAWFRKHGYKIYVDRETADYIDGEEVVPRKKMGGKKPDFALVLGGAGGNLFDRILSGRVTDFLDFYIRDYHWPAFNVADSALVVGCGLLLLDMLRPQRQAPNVP